MALRHQSVVGLVDQAQRFGAFGRRPPSVTEHRQGPAAPVGLLAQSNDKVLEGRAPPVLGHLDHTARGLAEPFAVPALARLPVTTRLCQWSAWALAAGRPLVCTSATGNAEMIAGSLAGRVVSPGGPVALADALRPYLIDQGLTPSWSGCPADRTRRGGITRCRAGAARGRATGKP
jgi:hypothetical protein